MRKLRIALAAGIVLALGGVTSASGSPATHTLLAPPPSGVSVSPYGCASKVIFSGFVIAVCMSEYASFSQNPHRIYISGELDNHTSDKDIYINWLDVGHGGQKVDKCEVNGWLRPGSFISCGGSSSKGTDEYADARVSYLDANGTTQVSTVILGQP